MGALGAIVADDRRQRFDPFPGLVGVEVLIENVGEDVHDWPPAPTRFVGALLMLLLNDRYPASVSDPAHAGLRIRMGSTPATGNGSRVSVDRKNTRLNSSP